MTVRSHLLLPVSVVVLGSALVAPAAFAEDTMGKDSMSKPAESKMGTPMTKKTISPMSHETTGMKKGGMAESNPHTTSDGMKK